MKYLCLACLLILPQFASAQVGIIAVNNGGERVGLFHGRIFGRYAAGGCTSANAGSYTTHHVVRERVRVVRTRSYGCQGSQAQSVGGCTSSQGGAYQRSSPAPTYATPSPTITTPTKPGTKANYQKSTTVVSGFASTPAALTNRKEWN